jgi:hypothetical protein
MSLSKAPISSASLLGVTLETCLSRVRGIRRRLMPNRGDRAGSIRRVAAVLFIAAISFLGSSAATAQTNTAALEGVVRDSVGAIVPDAVVTVVHLASGLTQERKTDGTGGFLFPSLPVGEYTITVERAGFKRGVRNGLVLELGQTAKVEVVLQAGDIAEQVTIASGEPLMKTSSAEISDVIENNRIVQLPLNGRQFLQLALLSEGVVKPPGGTRGAALQQAGDLINVAGQRSGHNIYLLDGVKVTDEYFNNMVISLSIDAIQEFKIQKSMYSPEFGGKASALINVATKSGANHFHGTVFEFLRNDVFDARNFFDNPVAPIPPFRQNQFGAVLGGPISVPGVYDGRNRAFFFLSYEGQRVRRSITNTFSVPTAAVRAGDFSGLGAIYDPLSTDASGKRTAFSDNRIPMGRMDPVATALLAKIPLPNLPGNVQNLVSAAEERTDMDQGSVRLDHQLSKKDNIFGRLSVYRVDAFQPFGTTVLSENVLPGFGRVLTTDTINLALSYTHLFNSNVLNESRFGWLTVSGGQSSQNQGVDFAGQSGLLGVTRDPRDVGYPQVSFGSLYSAMGDPTTFVSRRDRDFELFDNVLVHHSRHTVKFGAYLFHFAFNPSNPDTARGALSYTNKWTSSAAGLTDGNAFADFLLGCPTAAQVGIGRGDENGRTNWVHLYVQDDWQAAPNLTINLGLRYEVNQQMVDINNRLSAIDLAVPGGRFVIASDGAGRISPSSAPLLGLLPVPFVTSAQAGWSRSLLRPSYKRFAPRFGIAWKVPGKSETTVRAGFGIYLNQAAYSVQQALARNLPFFLAKSISTASDALIPSLNTENILTSTAIGTIGGNDMDHGFRVEYNEAWSLSVQHLLTPTTLFELSYLGSRTIGADSSTVLNVPLPGPGPIAARRPVQALSSFSTIRWDGWATYHALTAKAERRLSKGITFAVNYTWSRSMDDASDPGGTTSEVNLPQDVRNLPAEKAPSSFDHRHRFVCGWVYELPFGRASTGIRETLLAGWQGGGIVTVQSGSPFTVNLGVDRANIGSGPAQRPDVSHDPNLGSGRTPERWFDTSAFTLPQPFTFGNAGRNTVLGPGYSDVDFSIQKQTRLTEALKLRFRAEAFNLFNHPNFDTPNRIAFTPNFGRIFSAQPSRQIQLGLKLEF